jgi:23S rRNA pseudouridine955/2504/2580 synthase
MKKSPSRTVTVDPDEADRRLDNFLLSRLKGLPRALIYRMIRGGEVRVNKGRARPSRRLAEGDRVRIPPVHLTTPVAGQSSRVANTDWLESRVVYEDRDLLVLNKPAGLAVHGGSGVSLGVIELLRQGRAGHDQKDRLELVHRLDRDTSGCLLIAKRHSSLRRLHEQFREGQVQKQYSAVLVGRWKGGARTVRDPLITHHRRGGERHVRVDPEGKPALTRFHPEKQFEQGILVSADLGTGRTHQIRVHAAHIGHPVAGDVRYGSESDAVCGESGLNRLFLHATRLRFENPQNTPVDIECPLDADLRAVLDRLS